MSGIHGVIPPIPRIFAARRAVYTGPIAVRMKELNCVFELDVYRISMGYEVSQKYFRLFGCLGSGLVNGIGGNELKPIV